MMPFFSIHLRRCRVLLPLAVLCALAGPLTGGEVSREYQLKAAFLFNFAKFVEWPNRDLANNDRPIVIGVFRTNPFGGVLEKSVAGRKINGHPVVVSHVDTASAARRAHLLFVGAAQDPAVAELTASLKGAQVLTVGETTTFARCGGIITFKLQDDSVRFTINPQASRDAGIKISAQLQKLASKTDGKSQ
jgi:hypothetical protein